MGLGDSNSQYTSIHNTLWRFAIFSALAEYKYILGMRRKLGSKSGCFKRICVTAKRGRRSYLSCNGPGGSLFVFVYADTWLSTLKGNLATTMEPSEISAFALQGTSSIESRLTPPPEEDRPIIVTQDISLETTRCSKSQSMPQASQPARRPPKIDTTAPTLETKGDRRKNTFKAKQDDQTPTSRRISPSMSNLTFSPRPYEDLFVERGYLTGSLQALAVKHDGLIRKYSATSAAISVAVGEPRRKLKKHLKTLETRLTERMEQAKAIHTRLGEITWELQSKCSWTRAQQQVYQQELLSYQALATAFGSYYDPQQHVPPWPCSPITTISEGSASSMSSSYISTCPTTPLNCEAPAFIPRQPFVGTVKPNLRRSRSQTTVPLETVEEANEEACTGDSGMVCDERGRGEDVNMECRCTLRRSKSGAYMRRNSSRGIFRSASLPNLKCLWPYEDLQEGHQLDWSFEE